MSNTLGDAVVILASELQTGFYPLIMFGASLLGVIMIFSALVHIKKASEAQGQQYELKGAWVGLVMGSFLISFPFFIDVINSSFGNFGGSSSLGYGSGGSSNATINAAFTIVQTVGLIMIIKGLHVVHKISKNQGSNHTIQQAFGWIVFGGAAFQIKNVIVMLANSIGIGSSLSLLGL